MRRQLLPAILAGALLTTTGIGTALSAVSFDIHFGTRAPARYYRVQPAMVVVPNTEVYYVEGPGYDMYRYGTWWYVNEDGYWYRARSYRGPYVSVSYSTVPRQIVIVPARYHSHPFRPASWKARGASDWKDKHDNGRRRHGGD